MTVRICFLGWALLVASLFPGSVLRTASLPADQKEPGARTDVYGDPLPDGAIARLGTASRMRTAAVYSLAFSPDGKTVAAATRDGVQLWDAVTGKELQKLQATEQGQRVPIYLAAFLPDSKTLATGSKGLSPVRLWDAATGKELVQFVADQTFDSSCLALASDGKTLAAGSYSDDILLWDVSRGVEILKLKQRGARAIAFSPDGKTLASLGPGIGAIRLWELPSGKELRQLGRGERFRAIAFSQDGKELAAADNPDIRLWETATGRELPPLKGSKVGYSAVAFLPENKLVAADYHGVIHIWDAVSWKKLDHFPAGEYFACSADGKVLAFTRFTRGAIGLWDVVKGKELDPVGGHQGLVTALAFSPDSRVLVSGAEDNTIRLWEPATSKEVRRISAPWDPDRRYGTGISSVAYTPDGKTLAAIGNDGSVRLWDPATGKELRQLTQHPEWYWRVLFSPDGKYLAASGNASTVRLWEAATGKELPSLDVKTAVDVKILNLGVMAFAPDGKTLAVLVSYDASAGSGQRVVLASGILLWDVAAGKEVGYFKSEGQSGIYAITFSPDGKCLALAGYDGVLPQQMMTILREVPTGKEIRRFPASVVYSIAFSPDGKTLAAGGGTNLSQNPADTAVTLWDVDTGRELRQLHGHRLAVMRLVFSPDGTMLASGSMDTSVLVWDLSGAGKKPK